MCTWQGEMKGQTPEYCVSSLQLCENRSRHISEKTITFGFTELTRVAARLARLNSMQILGRIALFVGLITLVNQVSSRNVSEIVDGDEEEQETAMLPGTKWCGPGNAAADTGELGK